MGWRDAPLLSEDIPAVAKVESGGNPNAVSPAGAQGVMQVMPGTNKDPGFGVVPARDNSEAERTRVGEDYLSVLQKRYGREGGLQAYNMGPGNYEKWQRNGGKLNAETAAYVPKVNAAGGKQMASWRDAPLDEEPNPQTGQPGASTIPGASGTPTPQEPPGLLQRAKAAAGRLVDQAQTKEGWKAAGLAAAKAALDTPNALVTGAGKFMAPVVGAVEDVATRQPLGTSNRATQQSIDQFSQDTALDPNSAGYAATQAVPEIAATAGPMGRATNVVASRLPSVVGRVAADAGVNAAYAGGKSALEGNGITDVMADAAMGGAGAAGGRAVTGLLGGAKAALPEARRLLVERGGLPSAGQIFGGLPERIERGFAGTPLIGKATGAKQAIADAENTFSTADVNRALEGTGKKVTTSGETAVKEAVDHVDQRFENLIPQTRMGPRAAANAVHTALRETLGANTPTSSQRWTEAYNAINDETGILTGRMKYSTGREAKDVDANLNRMIEDNRENNPELARVARVVKQRLREALTPVPGAPNSVTTDLQRTNRSRAQLYDLQDAARTAGARTGHFTPSEAFEARAANGPAPVNDVMSRGARETQLANRPESDTAAAVKLGLAGGAGVLGFPYGKALLAGLASGAPGATLSGATGLGAAGIARLANTRAGRRFLLEGLAGGLPRGGIRDIMQSEQLAQLAAQAGRSASTGD